MSFTPVNELERLLMDAAKDPAARPAFYRAIVDHDLFVISNGKIPEVPRQIVADDNTTFQVQMIEIEGSLHIPIFTSVERISAEIPKESGYVAAQGGDILKMLRGNDLILNPGAEYGKVLTRQEVDSILDGSIFGGQQLDVGGKRILLGQPSVYPQHVVDALRKYFERTREVNAAYLAHAFIPDIDKEPHTVIGIEMTQNSQEVIRDAGLVVREVAKEGEYVDLVVLTSGSDDIICQYMKGETSPFYRRKKWFGLF